ncbi:MAG: slipin family protein, partial [Candidatus Peregrinibacteria bacterium]|nr:slipin family protein [Candidatus Peregrinibacteria bacterium]
MAGFDLIAGLLTGFGPLIIIVLVLSIRQVNEYERGVMFTLGKFTGVKSPGWRIAIPVFQRLVRVDLRTKVVDVPDQEAITKDNISVRINAVIYYKVNDAAKSIIEVENFYFAVSQLAQTTMRNAVGEVELDELLRNRDDIAAKIKEIVDKASDPWGILVETVELKDIGLPDNMKRTMAKAAEAEREKRAVIINSEGEVAASENMRKAAQTLSEAPGALHLRTLQSINDLSSDQSNTTIWMVPIEALRALEAVVSHQKKD